jgi:hypothetical protein
MGTEGSSRTLVTLSRLHYVTSQKTATFILSAMKASNLTCTEDIKKRRKELPRNRKGKTVKKRMETFCSSIRIKEN